MRTNRGPKSGRAKVSTDKTTTGEPIGCELKAQTSRDAAELIALIKASAEMRVIDVLPDMKVDESTFRLLMNHKVPTVFRQLAHDWKCVQNWSKEGYLKRAATEEEETLPHRKYRQFLAQSSEKGRLHLTDGKSKAKPVSMREFLDHTAANETDNSLYLLGIHSIGQKSSLHYCPVQLHDDDNNSCPPLSRDVPTEIEFLEWYANLLADRQNDSRPVRYDHQQFFLAKGYAFTDLHYDSYDNFYVATSGTRKWTLACPNASRWLISSSAGKLNSGSSIVPHQNIYPRGSPAQVYPFAHVELQKGDVLFVPNCWWHLVESVPGDDGFSSAFNFFFSRPPDDVFAEFQRNLGRTDQMVNELQSVCRSNLATAHSGVAVKIDIPAEVIKPPGNLRPSLWEQVLKVNDVHDLGELLSTLHSKLMNHSLEKFRLDVVVDRHDDTDLNHKRDKSGIVTESLKLPRARAIKESGKLPSSKEL
jgi:hypothetical protein